MAYWIGFTVWVWMLIRHRGPSADEEFLYWGVFGLGLMIIGVQVKTSRKND